MDEHRGDFGLIINLKRPPLDEIVCAELTWRYYSNNRKI